MTRATVLAVLLLSTPAAAQTPTPMPWFGLPQGLFTPIGDNELRVVSTMPDPVKVRLAIKENLVESNLGGVSFNTERVGSTTQDERALLMGRLTADRRGGAVYLAVSPSQHESVREVFYIDNGAAIFRVPVTAPNLGSGGAASFLVAGAYELHLQASDGNFVLYELVQGTHCPRWAVTWIGSTYRNGSGYVDPAVLPMVCR